MVDFVTNVIKYSNSMTTRATERHFSQSPTAKYVNGEGRGKNYRN